ncbi:MAG: RNB domain-containing ribonuclease [Candidatus Thiodiazotropha taylori]|nr:RNB domain-containing ribonuclease [Candidatus Thiodiazotropha taylori]MCW4223743.1 RNB domain-containing ribonuclease [Candidatus Thiodiazotropha endolucinida]MCG7885320.1 RNB domain-containing ribonuclease [Candidatus Thiodiazotropha taylori]MCG7891904.1 RNB domain-containing ribonuclease [Candidatus Thiodiazotropha taylori]MCG8034116.1 RNB domain-containing ribonuclease [Candidatus Thiodiazotropha taylori]
MSRLTTGALVLYKIRPARVIEVTDKITIELEGGKSKRVRDKDVVLLHPGPLSDLKQLTPQNGEVEENWELLEGAETDIKELSELVFGDYTPAMAWASWQLVAEGIYFEGSPASIHPRSADAVESEIAERNKKAAEAEAWEGFMQRVRSGAIIDEDRKTLGEVEALALEKRENSRILQALEIQETPVNAHRLLIKTGYWPVNESPYPRRMGIDETIPDHAVPPLPEEARLDLTRLPAYAIDDEDNQDPDDAVSLDDERIWVHVADVAALVTPDSEMDLDACARGANLYLPDRVIPMLPPQVTDRLGLGLQEKSPALSIGFTLSVTGEVEDVEIHPSWVRVERISYAAADQRLQEEPFAALLAMSQRYRQRRQQAGAATIQLPEVKIKARDDKVEIEPLPRLQSREMITDLMLMAGEGVAGFCQSREIAVPFATQAPPDQLEQPEDLAGMYAYHRYFKPTRIKTQAEPHAGLGLAVYTRATSPLRRYSDLLAHQQLRAHLKGGAVLDIHAISERIAQSELGSMANRKTERVSNDHWRLIYLRDNPGWQGEAVIVAKEGERATVLLPSIAMEARVRIRGEAGLNDRIRLKPREIDIPDLSCYFRVV